MADSEPGRGADESLTSLLIDSVVDYAIFALDVHGGVRSWNSGAERLKGYRADEIIGKDLSVFYTAEDRAAGLPARLLARAEAEGRVTHSGWRVRRDGSRFYADVTITALRDGDQQLQGFAKVTRDRTEQHRAELAMGRALERERQTAHELTQVDEARTQFMAAVSHDLQTPIGAILGSLDLLERPADDEDAELFDVIRRNAERLRRLTAQLSEMSRLERGRLEIDQQPTELATFVRDCIGTLGPVLDAVDVRVDVGGSVHADRHALERVLTNLLTNAVQHSPVGAPVTITSRPEGAAVLVSIEDRGPGVPREDHLRIFEEFRQGRSGAHGDGLGLGLNIVRQYVEQHGGRVWVEDGDHGGARFCFTLPTPPDEPPPTDEDVHGTP